MQITFRHFLFFAINVVSICATRESWGYDGFIYPVGNAITRPSICTSTSAGFCVFSDFGDLFEGKAHMGVDIADGLEGDDVRAIYQGTVTYVQIVDGTGFGNMVRIRHILPDGSTVYSQYAHLQVNSITVSTGDPVVTGEVIGRVDCTGRTVGLNLCASNGGVGPHIHFEIKKLDESGCGYIPSDICSPSSPSEDTTNYYNPLDFIHDHFNLSSNCSRLSPNFTCQLANDIGGQDIWTTSVYSYAPGGGGPGGGLNDEWLKVGGWGDLYYSLIQFNLTGLPANATKATIELYMPVIVGDGTTPLYLDRIASFWDWRIQGTGADKDRLWWVDQPSVYLTPGLPLPVPTPGEWYSIDITDLYNAWKSGTPNYGIRLRPVANNNQWANFYSSNYAGNPALRPKLVVTTNSVVPACMDGIDNDGDGVSDTSDPGCWADPSDPSTYDPFDNDENNLGNGTCESVSGENFLTAPLDCLPIFLE